MLMSFSKNILKRSSLTSKDISPLKHLGFLPIFNNQKFEFILNHHIKRQHSCNSYHTLFSPKTFIVFKSWRFNWRHLKTKHFHSQWKCYQECNLIWFFFKLLVSSYHNPHRSQLYVLCILHFSLFHNFFNLSSNPLLALNSRWSKDCSCSTVLSVIICPDSSTFLARFNKSI